MTITFLFQCTRERERRTLREMGTAYNAYNAQERWKREY